MSKILDLIGTSLDSFRVGNRFLSGVKSLIFDNGFTTVINSNPTANRVITIPDNSGTLAFNPSVINVSASKTLVANDASTFQNCTNSAAITITVPTDVAVPFPLGTEIVIYCGNASVTIVGASGVTITRLNGTVHELIGVGAICTLKEIATDNWILVGDF